MSEVLRTITRCIQCGTYHPATGWVELPPYAIAGVTQKPEYMCRWCYEALTEEGDEET